jgi:hypothetical protein
VGSFLSPIFRQNNGLGLSSPPLSCAKTRSPHPPSSTVPLPRWGRLWRREQAPALRRTNDSFDHFAIDHEFFRYPVCPKKVFSIREKIFWKKVFTFRRIYGIIRMYAIYASKCHKFKRKEELQYGKQNSC